LKEFPVTVLTGPRQSGKTTLSRIISEHFKSVTSFDLEKATARQALSTPELTLTEITGIVILDEIQRMPQLFSVLRPLSDRQEKPASFLLLGSTSPDLMKGVSETLAGRSVFVRVTGFLLEEIGKENQNELWLKGGFPRAYLSSETETWF
jgi:predicted AAA+ superfamily ATPase